MTKDVVKAINEMKDELASTFQNLKQEDVEITDSSTGIKINLSSRELGIKELTDLAAAAFSFAKNQRNGNKPKPSGID